MYDLMVRGGTIVSPSGSTEANLIVDGGRVVALTADRPDTRRVIDANGLLVLPGMVDEHVHFMDPGPTEREDFITGSRAAAVGGVTTVIEHTHAQPVRSAEFLREKSGYLADRSLVDYGLAAHVWPEDIAALPHLWAAGATLFKVFTCTTHGVPAILPGKLLELLRTVASFDGLCLLHCEDESITGEAEERLHRANRTDPRVILEWRSREAEAIAVGVAATIARWSGARVISAHASQPEVVDLATRERARGARIRVETCPQYLYLREDEIDTEGPFRKFTPPARSEVESDGLWERIARGEIDHVQTDHAPATREQKLEGSIWECHFGLPGIETTLTMLLEGVAAGRITIERLVDLYSERPARTLGLYPRKGALLPGSDADFVLVDPSATRTLRNEDVVSKAGWTPYHGRRVHGRPVLTALRGQVIAENGRPSADPGTGLYQPGPGVKPRA
jgi:dihydroorotase (multifunctional complex type)